MAAVAFPRALGCVALALVLSLACAGEDESGPGAGAAGSSGTPPLSGAGGALAGRGAEGGAAGTGAAGGTPSGGSATAGAGAAGTAGAGAAGTASAGGSGASAGTSSAGAGGSGAGGSAGVEAQGGAGAEGGASSLEPLSVLVFSHTTGFRHDSIPAGVQALTMLAAEREWTLFATEDPALFSDTGLEPYDIVVFLLTSGDVFGADEKAAFERFISAGNGYVGIHSASDTEFNWPFYGELVGAYFREHPAIQPATITVENGEHPATAHLAETWTRTDEWYAFDENPRDRVSVLLSLDETSYDPGSSAMDGDHPIAWYQVYLGSRSFYTALGHTIESYSEPPFLEHIAGAIEWAGGR